MATNKPTRARRATRKAKTETPVNPPPSQQENKYAPKAKVGKPNLRSPITVTTVGLGNLKVETANGTTDV